MNKIISLFVAGALVACGTTPCEEYQDAVQTCSDDLPESLGSEAEGVDAEAVCASDEGSTDELFTCYADAYNAGDCSTEEGFTDVATAAASCLTAE